MTVSISYSHLSPIIRKLPAYAPIFMRNFPEHYLPRVREFVQCLGLRVDAKSDAELLDLLIDKVEGLQAKSGIQTRFDIDVDASEYEHLVKEIKEDPAGMQYPLSDDVIDACLKDSLNVRL